MCSMMVCSTTFADPAVTHLCHDPLLGPFAARAFGHVDFAGLEDR